METVTMERKVKHGVTIYFFTQRLIIDPVRRHERNRTQYLPTDRF